MNPKKILAELEGRPIDEGDFRYAVHGPAGKLRMLP